MTKRKPTSIDIRTYFIKAFPEDIKKLAVTVPNDVIREVTGEKSAVFFGGTDWRSARDDLDRVDGAARTKFVLCLFMAVVIDQTIHAHFGSAYDAWRKTSPTLKFGWTGLGPHHENPLILTHVPERDGLLNVDEALALVPDFLELFRSQVEAAVALLPSAITATQFFVALATDPAMNYVGGPLTEAVKLGIAELARK